MIKKIEIDGLLSFEKFELELRNLNVLIGPNGSGKSNLIEVLGLLQALPTDDEPMQKRYSWFRPGYGTGERPRIQAEIDGSAHARLPSTRYEVALGQQGMLLGIADESIAEMVGGNWHPFDVQRPAGLSPVSVLNPRLIPSLPVGDAYGAAIDLGGKFRAFRIYNGWQFGGDTAPRLPQSATQSSAFLKEDAANLSLVMQDAFLGSGLERPLNTEFRRFFDRFSHFKTTVNHGMLFLLMYEEGLDNPIEAERWSDGMIRYACLLTILLHPSPPPLICIDEPELGFHPDVMPDLARLIQSAAERTQVIITTHSRDLVDGFTDDPAAVVVCERDFEGATRMERLDAEQLAEWLERYTLGELWEKGEIGGNRY